MEMGEKIKMLREQKSMTLEELGNKVGVGKSTVRKWENGMIANMRRDKIAKIANALDCSPAYLLGWDQKEIDAVAEMQKETNKYSDRLENKFKSFMEEFGELQLTKEELQEVFDYAKYVKSKRK